MRRRAVLGLGPALVLEATRAFGQGQARVGWLTIAPHPGIEGFRKGMSDLGWIEGGTLTIDYAYADRRPERLPDLARALANGPAQVIVASGSDAVAAARAVITAQPIIAVSTANAIGVGENLARPPGNVTGVALLFDEIAAKWVEALSELLPPSSRLGVIHDFSLTNRAQYEMVRRTANALRHEAVSFPIETIDNLAQAVASARRESVAGLIVVSSPIFTASAAHVAELAQASGLPAMFESRWIVQKGGLMSYGPDFDAVFRRAAHMADRILKGARPADFPIEQPTKFELVINMKTARALGLTVPLGLLVRADEVIE
jgi:putative ABC transport system substrate-binding protein